MNRSLLFLACAGVLCSGTATALADETLDTVTVSASRAVETVDASLATVSVITREDIERSQALDLRDLLRREAGFDIARSGGPGSATSLFLRGTNSNQTLVLVDGVRVSAFSTGALDLASIPVSQIERVEIVRGPRAAYWGSDAIGGVVQIFTRRLDGPMLSGQAGSFGTRRGQAGWGVDGESGRLGITVAHERARGFSAKNEDGFGFHPDDDGYRQRSVTLSGGLDVRGQSLDLKAFHARTDSKFDSAAPADQPDPAESFGKVRALALNLGGELSTGWQHLLTVARSHNDLDTPVNGSSFRTRRTSVDWQNSLRVAESQSLLFGLNLLDEEGFADNGFTPAYDGERDSVGAYLGWRAAFGALDAELVGRHDDYSDFGGEFTGSASLGWRLADTTRLVASFGEGFRAPNLNELYSPGSGGFFAGNPDLDPERSRTAEIGADFNLGQVGAMRVRGFRTRVRDLISFTGGGVAQAENIARARIDGVELEYDLSIDHWLFSANGTWQDPRNVDTDTVLLRRARRRANIGIDRQFGDFFSAGVQVELVGSRDDFGFPSNVRMAGYGLVHLRAAWSLSPDWTLDLSANNILDKDYTEVFGFNTPGRSAFIGFRWQPK